MKLINTLRDILYKIGYFCITLSFVFLFSTSYFLGCFGTPENTSTNSSVTIIPNNNSFLELDFSVTDYEITEVRENGTTFSDVLFENGVRLNKKGYASLPFLSASVQLPIKGEVDYEIINEEYIDIPLDHPFLPSKGTIYRNQNPDDVMRTIDPASLAENIYPNEIAKLSDPYIFRDVRGVNIYVYPFRYNALNKTLRVYTKLRVSLNYINDGNSKNVMNNYPGKIVQEMKPIYKSLFINYGSLNSNSNIRRSFSNELAEFGEILVIHTSRDASAIIPYVNWKRQLGYTVHTLEVAKGKYVESIIRNEYNANNNLLYIQLVGDWADIKSELGTNQSAPMDPMLGCVNGYDNYPDLIIGRFSAENTTHVTTQINKGINYEKNPDTSGTWYTKALGLGSGEGPGDDSERDYTHIDNIHNYRLKPFTYTQTLRYTDGDSYTTTRNAVNSGVGIINYTGHGDWNKFVTTGFDNGDVSALTNGNKLPFIISVACLNGKFHGYSESFAETWLRKTNGGAVATLMSTINQPWQPPMRGQDYMNDLLVGGYNYSSNPGNGTSTTEGRTTFGAITFNGLVLMYSESSYSSDLDTLQTWSIFGDAALQVRTAQPRSIAISNKSVKPGQAFAAKVTSNGYAVQGARVALSQGTKVYTAVTNSSGNVTIPHGLPGGAAKLVVSGFNLDTLVYDVNVINDGGNNPPVAGFTYSVDKLAVQFTDKSTDYEGPIARRLWNFGDGQTSTEVNPVHVFAQAGTYTVKLVVTDSEGLDNTYSSDITVTDKEGPVEVYETFTDISIGSKEENNYSFNVVPQTNFKAEMTGDNDADLYVKYGQAPTSDSYDCRPYLNGSVETCEGQIPSGIDKAYVKVVGYEASTYSLTVTYTKGEGSDEPECWEECHEVGTGCDQETVCETVCEE